MFVSRESLKLTGSTPKLRLDKQFERTYPFYKLRYQVAEAIDKLIEADMIERSRCHITAASL